MAEKSASPFSGLDKALIRSTKPAPLPDPVKEDVLLEQEEPAKERRTGSHGNGRTFERSNERDKIRHSFDIYRDQLLSLSDIQADIFRQTGKKPKVGDLVQEALDAFVSKYGKKAK